jgi:hypothetical protein
MNDLRTDADQAEKWLAHQTKNGKFAQLFLRQVASALSGRPVWFGNTKLYVDPHAIRDEIARLEGTAGGRSLTKPASEFRHRPLEGLWKKHWFQASFMLANINNEIERSGEHIIRKALQSSFPDGKYEGKIFGDLQAKAIAAAVVSAGYEKKARRGSDPNSGKVTGEWIVFAKVDSGHHYLTLAVHDEDPLRILSRCMPALTEFPTIAEIRAFSAINILGAVRATFR